MPPSDDRPVGGRPILRALLSVLVFAGTLALCALGARSLFEALPGEFLDGDGPAQKLHRLEARGDEVQLLFLGSSRVYRQLNPAVFDARLAERGVSLVSYNLGLPGMRFHEQLYLAERLIEERPPALRWLLFELLDPDPELEEANLLSRRNIEWHTPGLTWFALRTTLESPRPLPRKLGLGREHLELCLLRSFNAGLGPAALLDLLGGERLGDPTPRGYLPLDLDPTQTTAIHRRRFQRDLAQNPRLLEERVQAIQQPGAPPGPLLAAEMRSWVARLEAAGIQPLFFLSPPADRNNSDWRALREQGVLPNLFAFDDPAQYPDFYLERSIRFDMNHMDRVGGSRLTRLLAEALAPSLAASGTEGER